MKLRLICKSKIHHARVTGADLHYIGSIGIDRDLMDKTDLLPGEQVAIWNLNNGARIETYAIPLPRGCGQIIVNGAAARHFHKGDIIIIAAFAMTDEVITPSMIVVDEQNRLLYELPDHDSSELDLEMLPSEG